MNRRRGGRKMIQVDGIDRIVCFCREKRGFLIGKWVGKGDASSMGWSSLDF